MKTAPTTPASDRGPALRRRVVVLGVGLLGLLLGVPAASGALGTISAGDTGSTPKRVVDAPHLSTTSGHLIAAVGDIACAPNNDNLRGLFGTAAGCQSNAVGDLLDGQRVEAFLPLGDEQYETGALSEFQQVFDQSFGRFKAITRPVPGNHEYMTPSGAGYYAYFGAAAHEGNTYGARAAGDYSYDIGGWHVLAINSNMCAPITPCDPSSATMRWVTADLAAHPARCTLAYWHHPIWSIGEHGDYAPMIPVWNALYDAGADVVLTSHDHNYQRYAPIGRAAFSLDRPNKPQAPVIDPDRGIQAFIVGTGGANNYSFQPAPDPGIKAAMQVGNANAVIATFGVLFMRLGDDGYSYDFTQADTPARQPFEDHGSGQCH